MGGGVREEASRESQTFDGTDKGCVEVGVHRPQGSVLADLDDLGARAAVGLSIARSAVSIISCHASGGWSKTYEGGEILGLGRLLDGHLA